MSGGSKGLSSHAVLRKGQDLLKQYTVFYKSLDLLKTASIWTSYLDKNRSREAPVHYTSPRSPAIFKGLIETTQSLVYVCRFAQNCSQTSVTATLEDTEEVLSIELQDTGRKGPASNADPLLRDHLSSGMILLALNNESYFGRLVVLLYILFIYYLC